MSTKVSTMCLSLMLILTVSLVQAENWDQSGGSQQQQQQDMQPNGQMNGQANGQMQSLAAGQSNMTQLEPLIGKTVLDSQQSELGTIQDIVVDSQSQQAKYVILGVGGFLGIGEDYHAVPWSALNIQVVGDSVQSVSTSLDSQTITNSPTVEMGTTRSFDSRMKSQIDSYYQGKGVSIQSNGMSNGAGQDQQPSQRQDIDIIPRETNGTNGAANEDIEIIPGSSNGTYGNGVRSGEPQAGSKTETDQSDSVSPFGAQSNGTEDTTDSDSATRYRSGYSQGRDRLTQDTDAQSNGMSQENGTDAQSNGTLTQENGADADVSVQEQHGSVQTNGASQQFVWFSELKDRQVKNSQDEQIGQLKDLVVDAKQGDINFGLISMDDGMVAVPFSALQMQQDSLIVNAQKDMLKSLAFQSDNKPDFSDPSFQQRTYQQFGQQPPTVYGYVPPQQSADSESQYTNKFDLQKIETVSGKIQQIHQHQDQPGQMQQGAQQQKKAMEFTMQTDQGKTLKVHAAPKEFLKDRGLELSQGDTVRITGSKVQHNGQELLIASKISKDTKEVMLRSAQGQPMWSTGQSGSQAAPGGQKPQSNGVNGQTNGLSDQEKKDQWKSDGTSGTNGQTDSQLQQDQSQSQYGNGMIDSQMNGQTDGLSDQEKKDQWKSDDTNGTNGSSGTDSTSGQPGQLQFRSDEQTSVSGTVQSTDSSPGAMAAMDQAVLLNLQTDQGQTQTVYAGPRDFIQKKNMSFNQGDQITVTGWKKTIAGQEVFIASKIEKDGQTLQLRDMQGNPEWKTKGSGLYNGMDSHKNSNQINSSESHSTY